MNRQRIKQLRINHQIRVPAVRVIDDQGKPLGVMPLSQALALAQSRTLDLVEVSPLEEPPVCRVLDWGRYKYQLQRKDAKKKAKTKKISVKGIRLSFKISDHDMQTRRSQTEKFLKEGNKVRVEIILRGREHAHKDIAKKVIQEFINGLNFQLKVEQPVMMQGHVISTIVARSS